MTLTSFLSAATPIGPTSTSDVSSSWQQGWAHAFGARDARSGNAAEVEGLRVASGLARVGLPSLGSGRAHQDRLGDLPRWNQRKARLLQPRRGVGPDQWRLRDA